MIQAEMEKAAHEFVQRLQVRADPWEVSEKTLVELFTKFALAQRKEAVQKYDPAMCPTCTGSKELPLCPDSFHSPRDKMMSQFAAERVSVLTKEKQSPSLVREVVDGSVSEEH